MLEQGLLVREGPVIALWANRHLDEERVDGQERAGDGLEVETMWTGLMFLTCFGQMSLF